MRTDVLNETDLSGAADSARGEAINSCPLAELVFTALFINYVAESRNVRFCRFVVP